MKKRSAFNGARTKKNGFNPSRREISLAVQEYLAKGGKITRIQVVGMTGSKDSYQEMFQSSYLTGV